MLHSQARDGLIFGSNMTAQWRKPQLIIFFHAVLPECNAPPASNCSPTSSLESVQFSTHCDQI
jgi:hypothetical protein